MIRYSTWPEQKSPGGQHVGSGPSGIRGVHYLIDPDGSEYPTGIEACCGAERSQFKNRLVVGQMIEWACAETRTPFEL